MEVELLEREGNRIKIRIIGEGHTFCNVLRKELHKDENIETAAYDIEHPLLSEPVFHVKTKEGDSPEDALIRASNNLSGYYGDLQDKVEQALEQ